MVSDNPQHHGLRNSGETSNTPPGAEGPSTPWYQGPACKGEVKEHASLLSTSSMTLQGTLHVVTVHVILTAHL